ncbi:PREDICTED: basic form of pathogenesis-related protein 1-like [Fragaria vesca subsp. vesca]|uniref:basic form of pathogenesis-related protein 1-like n=1 Tax=Fragaria vesca subsp. vesca TaxID=101020 RepID=UPI0002C36FF7|nr:PREDICTED: basic form of pathogenesis-related protein 1-like [Fragaria vesca subsp. vesca]
MASLLTILLCFIVLTVVLLVQPSHAQNSPQDYVDAHNAARLRVGVPNITWDDTVAAYAQHYANLRSGDCSLVHSHGPYGENLAYGYGSGAITGVNAVNLWLEEKPYYNHNSNCCVGGECLHYTQVIWHYSIRLGCARVQCSNPGCWFVTCNYDPPGNYYGKRPY